MLLIVIFIREHGSLLQKISIPRKSGFTATPSPPGIHSS